MIIFLYSKISCILTYKIATFSGFNVKSITLNFNQPIDSASANTNCDVSGNSVTITYNGWSPSSPIDITVTVGTGLSTLDLKSYSYTET